MKMRRLFLFLALASACSSSDDGPAAPDADTLFATRRGATPGVLRGVWGRTTIDDKGSTELRIEFTDAFVIGGARCVPPGASASILAGKSVRGKITGLDADKGSVTIDAALAFNSREGDIVCQAAIASAPTTFAFTVTGTQLTLGAANSTVTSSFTKIGD